MLGVAMHITIKTLFEKGYNKTQIAKIVGCSRKAVRRALKRVDEGQELRRKTVPSIIDAYEEIVRAKVAQGLTAVRIHQDLVKETSYKGSYSTVKLLVRKIKKDSQPVYMHNVSLPGEEAQVDFGYAGRLSDSEGRLRKAWVFCYGFSFSKIDYYEVVFSQEVQSFLNCHIHAFRYFGGVPRIIKIDNLKSAVLKAHFYEPEYQRDYLLFSRHYGFSPSPSRVRTPTDNAQAESRVKYVKSNFFRGREFEDINDCNRQLREWTERVSHERIHGTTKRQPRELFEQEERPRLQVLPAEDYDMSLWLRRKVGLNCHLVFENNYYSVPYAYCGKEVTLQVTESLVKVYDGINPLSQEEGKLLCTHPRLKGQGKFQTNSAHYPSWKLVSKTEYQEKYRQRMAEIGPFAERYFQEIVRRQEGYWAKVIYGILYLAKKYGSESVNLACKRALFYEAYGYRVIKNILEKRLHQVEWEEPEAQKTVETSKMARPLSDYESLLD
ncbi:MAG: IS21 family transposase [Candidatus Saccharicenans sp.]